MGWPQDVFFRVLNGGSLVPHPGKSVFLHGVATSAGESLATGCGQVAFRCGHLTFRVRVKSSWDLSNSTFSTVIRSGL